MRRLSGLGSSTQAPGGLEMTSKKRQNLTHFGFAIAAFLVSGGHVAVAQDNVFGLGKLQADITVIGEPQDLDLTDDSVTVEDVWTFNRNTLDEAVKLIPGVTSTLDGTARRNEPGIYVRGFGRWQVPFAIDGIRIYLPADNRLDFNRFLTQDLAQIEVQKGYVSVLDGPGAMGGAVNLVTRKPTERLEAEVRTGFSGGERDAYAMLGTRRDGF
jgi:iron complex outermembrane receptor protein